jgi:hypothetical protein
MDPIVGFALLLALLWGPTAIWLGYRTIRGRRGPAFVSADDTLEPIEAGFWVCGQCHSMNRHEATLCYACHAAVGSAVDQPVPAPSLPAQAPVPVMAAPAELPASVPVMVAAAERPAPVAVMAAAAKRTAPDPVMAAPAKRRGSAQGPGAAPPKRSGPAAATVSSERAARLKERREAPVDAASACPFLGFMHDASTRCDFPDPRNVCHAASGRGASSSTSRPRLGFGVVGTRRTHRVDVADQESRCLSATHTRCARYAAAEAIAAN